jgi:succinyl-diaminopimelate desuccinylase
VEGHLQSAACQRLTFEGGHERWGYPVDNLFAVWEGNHALGHLCFIGHTDVVPPGDLKLWTHDPFSGKINAGFLHGRGATDMKGELAAFCVAASHCAATIPPEKRPRISMILTSDEEWLAINGVARVLEWMQKQGEAPSWFLVGEPSSPERFGTHIKIGRRGSLCGRLRVEGVQGHIAYPGLFQNPVRTLALALTILHGHQWNDALEGMPATNFETVALASGDFGITAIAPSVAEASWGIRFTSNQRVEKLMSTLQDLLNEPPAWAKSHPDASLLDDIEIIGNTATVSLPYYSPPARLASIVSDVIAAQTGCTPEMDTAGGTTDGRFASTFFPEAEIVELGLPENGGNVNGLPSAPTQGGMHQTDERCALADIAALTDCYVEIINNLGRNAKE